MSKKSDAVETPSDSKESKKGKNVERWISRAFSEHTIVIKINGESEAVRFESYCYDCDLSTARGKAISKELHRCGREGRDVFIIGEKYEENDIGNRSEMLKMLRDMGVLQLRSIVTIDELIEAGVPSNTLDPDELIAVILANKSIRTGDLKS